MFRQESGVAGVVSAVRQAAAGGSGLMVMPTVGEQFRQFLVREKAGEGGMEMVFRAHDPRLGRDVALKFLTRMGTAEAELLRVEARSLAALNHPNIVTIYDIGEEGGSPFLVLEWVTGADLGRSPIARPCAEGELLRIAQPIADALAAAHSRDIVHRDLKPGNVLLCDDGGVKLVDFGLARFQGPKTPLESAAAIRGTPAYMSPEQASGGEVVPASDVFSFGVLAYELLTGRRPFEGDSYSALLRAIVGGQHVPLATIRPDLSTAVTTVVDRCLRTRPEDRYSSGAGLALDLRRAARGRRDDTTCDLHTRIRTPTLVIHRRDDCIVPFEEGHLPAFFIPAAQFLPLSTGTHYFPVDDDVTHYMASAIKRLTAQSPG